VPSAALFSPFYPPAKNRKQKGCLSDAATGPGRFCSTSSGFPQKPAKIAGFNFFLISMLRVCGYLFPISATSCRISKPKQITAYAEKRTTGLYFAPGKPAQQGVIFYALC
jgi:hypothetical protein